MAVDRKRKQMSGRSELIRGPEEQQDTRSIFNGSGLVKLDVYLGAEVWSETYAHKHDETETP
jgi:hypothetical protein